MQPPAQAPPLATPAQQPDSAGGIEVVLHVYDVVAAATPSGGATGNGSSGNGSAGAAAAPAAQGPAPITRLNDLTRALFGGVGGVFHGAIQFGTGDYEYSFGYCERGSGVYHVRARANPMYTYRESVPLGRTALDERQVAAVLRRMREEWQGQSYDLLSRNCWCVGLGVCCGFGAVLFCCCVAGWLWLPGAAA